VQYLYRFLVSEPFNWVKKPTSVDSIWLTEAVSPGLAATKTLWKEADSLPCQGSLVIAPIDSQCSWGAELWQFLGDLAIEGKLLWLLEREVAQMVVPLHQFSLVISSGKGDVLASAAIGGN
jgi:hypothetical protein